MLGPLAVHIDGVPVAVPSVPQRVLLARLVLSPRRAVTASALVDVLWTETAPSNATANLHTYVSRLRRVLGTDRVIRETGGYRLNVDDVDIDRVDRLVTEARSVATRDPALAAERLGEAVRAWRGEPLSDLPDTLAFAPDLARLAAWRQQLEEEWFHRRLATGAAAQTLPDLEHAAAADPTREGVVLPLATALHQVGRTAEALGVLDRFRRRTVEESGLDPSPALADLQRRLLADDPTLRPPARTPRCPPSRQRNLASRLIGRGTELETARVALHKHRIVTIVGPGGVGKTRLAAEVLDGAAAAQPAYLVELGALSRPADVPATTAAALGLQAAPAGIEAAIADRLGSEPALLMVDDCEHLLGAARDLVTGLLGRCPALRVLATSRRRLGVAGERVLRLGPLAPDEQVELFCDRASLLRVDFEPTGPGRGLVAQICRTLDGLPLAVELAASREAVFGLRMLRDRLAAGLDVLEPARDGNRRTAVTATVEWCYRLLDPDAQRLSDRMAVCRGGFDLEVVEALASADAGTDNGGHDAANPAALLTELVEASLVIAEPSATPRYRLLEVMRRVGLDHLTAPQEAQARSCHATAMLSAAGWIHRLQLERSSDVVALLHREVANLREALGWLAESADWDRAGRLAVLVGLAVSDHPDLSLLSQLERLQPSVGGSGSEGAGLCLIAAATAAWVRGDAARADQLLSRGLDAVAHDHPHRWIGLLVHAMSLMYSGKPADVDAAVEVILRTPAAPEFATATAVCLAALMHTYAGDPIAAARWLTRGAPTLERVGQRDGFVAYTYGELTAASEPELALGWFEQAYRLCAAKGHSYNREVAGIGRAAVLIRLGRYQEAVLGCRSLVENLRSMGMWPQLWIALRLSAELLVALENPQAAAILLAAADADALAPAVFGPDLVRQEALRAVIADRLGEDRLAAEEAGRRDGRTGAAERALAALSVLATA